MKSVVIHSGLSQQFMMKVMVWRWWSLSQDYKLQLHLLSCYFPIVVAEISLQVLSYLWLKLTRWTASVLLYLFLVSQELIQCFHSKSYWGVFFCKSHSCKLEAPSNDSAPLHPTFAPYNCWNLLGMEDCNVGMHHCILLLPLQLLKSFGNGILQCRWNIMCSLDNMSDSEMF